MIEELSAKMQEDENNNQDEKKNTDFLSVRFKDRKTFVKGFNLPLNNDTIRKV